MKKNQKYSGIVIKVVSLHIIFNYKNYWYLINKNYYEER